MGSELRVTDERKSGKIERRTNMLFLAFSQDLLTIGKI